MPSKVPLLLVGEPGAIKNELAGLEASVDLLERPMVLEQLLEALDPSPQVVLASPPPPEIRASELAQLLRGVYPKSVLYLLLFGGQSSDRKNLMKNGFSDVFFFPMDRPVFRNAMLSLVAQAGSATEPQFKRVKLFDLAPGTVLDFSTYLHLPANNKHIKFSSAGDPIDEKRVKNLRDHAVSNLSVPLQEAGKFYGYAAQALKSIKANGGLSATERIERTESAVRELVTGLFNDQVTSTEEGREIVGDLQKIVKSYLSDTQSAQSGWYDRFLAVASHAAGGYSSAVVTSTYASLFAIALGVEEVEDIALAGLLHDLGLSKVPQEVLASPPESWLPVDREVYESHPEITLRIVRERKLVVSERVHQIIRQHHERFDGTGFPGKAAGGRICIGAQLLAIADALHEGMAPRPGKPMASPREVLRGIVEGQARDPAKAAFDPALLKKILGLFESGS